MRFFGGLSVEDSAAELGVSTATVEREWAVAKARLGCELKVFEYANHSVAITVQNEGLINAVCTREELIV
jgi:hypothetical protein